MVFHLITHSLDTKSFMNLAYLIISCKVSINGILMDKLLNFSINLLNLALLSLFLSLCGIVDGNKVT